jgi:aminoglycoside phosphotransferase (APT) family kinase protein
MEIESWLAAQGVADGPITDIEPIGGGTQNLMFRFQCGDASLVLRRDPRHLRPHTNDALRREARVLSALAETRVPIPRLVAAKPEESVVGWAFYVMEPVDGLNPSVALPPLHAEMQRAMGFAAVDALLAFGAVDADQVGLGDLGKPKASWNGKCRSGCAPSTSTPQSTATPEISCRTSTTSRAGSCSTAHRASSRASCTATFTWRT